MLVTHGDRALLARQASWTPRQYATLAGFVEPGESLEDAVAREVAEEVGVELREIRYHSSQPWPFPGSIMLGFRAEAAGTELTIDGHEIEDARWLTRSELRKEVDAGTILLPPLISIARALIVGWLEEQP